MSEVYQEYIEPGPFNYLLRGMDCQNRTITDLPSYEARPIVDLRGVFVPPFRFVAPTNLTDLATQ